MALCATGNRPNTRIKSLCGLNLSVFEQFCNRPAFAGADINNVCEFCDRTSVGDQLQTFAPRDNSCIVRNLRAIVD
jgi:hypothetical protein